MKNERSASRERSIPASKFRRALADLSEELTEGVEAIRLTLSGNTFILHLDGGTINITINESKEGGQS